MAAWLGITFELKTAIQALKKDKNFSNDDNKLLVNNIVIKGTKLVLDFDRNFSVEFVTLVADFVETLVACPKRHYDLLVTCIRCLRNAYADGRTPLSSPKAKAFTSAVLNFFHEEVQRTNDENLPLLRAGLQFLSNVTTSDTSLCRPLWLPAKSQANAFLEHEDKLSYYASLFYFNLVKSNLASTLEDTDFIRTLFRCVNRELEFCLYALELLVHESDYWLKVFGQLSAEEQSSSLDILHSCFAAASAGKLVNVQVMEQAVLHFKSCADSILQTCYTSVSEDVHQKALPVVQWLEILCLASANEQYRTFLQQDVTLLHDAVLLLRSIHALGKVEGEKNGFTAVDDLGSFDVNSTESEILRRHPAYGFRRDLIRLVGNLCYKHKRNQDQVRELEAIVPILESCSADARNPFITQWAVLAIRNLCEDNVSNQELIGSLTAQGVVQPTALRGTGYSVQSTKTGLRLTKDTSDKVDPNT